MSDISITTAADPTDYQVETWRLSVLLDAGYPPDLAELVAESRVDLHEAVDLLERGCPPPLAARILL